MTAFSYAKANELNFHNRKCMGVFRRNQMKGKNGPNFNKGIASDILILKRELRRYIAGLIDTDGYICIKNNGQVNMGISNSNKKFLNYIKKICGGGKIYRTCNKGDKTGKDGKYKFRKNVYSLAFRKKESMDLLPQIKDFLFIKKERAIKAIKLLSEIFITEVKDDSDSKKD